VINVLAWISRAFGVASLAAGIAAVVYSRRASSLSTVSEAAERSGDSDYQTQARLAQVTMVIDQAGAISRQAAWWTAISVVAGSIGGLVGSFAN
jgi:hypothetical protein